MNRVASALRRLARRCLPSVAAIAVAAMAVAPPAGAQSPTTIRIGGTFPGEEPIWYLVKRPELFQNANKLYALNWSVFQGTAPISQALIANAVDCGSQAPISFARGALDGGLQAYILGSLVDERPGYFSVFWGVLDDSPIRTIADLKGKTVGSTAIGGGTYYHMRLAMQAHGVDPDNDVKIVELPFPVQDQALRGHRVDAAVYAQPWGGATLKKGGVRKLFSAADVFSPLVNVFEVCRKGFVDSNVPAVRAFMQDYAAAVAYALQHPDETKKIVGSVTKMPVDVLDSFLLTTDDFFRPPTGRPDFATIQSMWDAYYAAKIIDKPLRIGDFQRLDVTPGG